MEYIIKFWLRFSFNIVKGHWAATGHHILFHTIDQICQQWFHHFYLFLRGESRMWFKAYIKSFCLVVGHPVNIELRFFPLSYISSSGFGGDLFTKPVIMRDHYL